jgi:hypothetical protein
VKTAVPSSTEPSLHRKVSCCAGKVKPDAHVGPATWQREVANWVGDARMGPLWVPFGSVTTQRAGIRRSWAQYLLLGS